MPFLSHARSRPHADTEPSPHWADQASCAGDRAAEFLGDALAARSICGTCPVRTECLTAALVEEAGEGLYEREGIRGGLNAHERWELDPMHTRPREIPTGDVEQARALLLAGELTDREISARTKVAPAALTPLRRDLGVQPAWAEVALRFHGRTRPSSDGHVEWAGGRGLIVGGTQFAFRQVAFRLGYGRPATGGVEATCGVTRCVAWQHLADQPMRQAMPKPVRPRALLPAVIEYLYGVEAEHREDGDDVWVPHRVVRFRVTRKTAHRIFYIRRENDGKPDIGSVDRHKIEAQGEIYRASAGWWEIDFHLYLKPPALAPTGGIDVRAAELQVAEARRTMAAAHPDRGGTRAAFDTARKAYEKTRRTYEAARAQR
ncbi:MULTISPECIES: WhiB family transcriptional regulator [unclassified Streptomyces]|uniref:WhiB family transcriptional regulator n=1 Tax=unclassified Streptomyces TaxID=2593676 RepID=UPI00226E1945|nr:MULTISPECIES: WhiB family transcriptional regulator [unclassified Streptomyces]MCY0921864.1 WhiB family transcriptional regulator [Streptomyces sp. H27-G5]MCY0957186.1 WhiB family transcriptional regulator [Streptomyces sp. H27-H5]